MQITPTFPATRSTEGSSNSIPNTTPINPLFDVSSSKSLSSLDADLQQAILKIGETDLSVQMQALIIDVLRLMATIRKQSMENMQNEANLAFDTAKLTASAQQSQARSSANAEFINAGASMGQAVADISTNAISSSKASAAEAKFKSEANGMDFSQLNPDGTPRAPAVATDAVADVADTPATAPATASPNPNPVPDAQAPVNAVANADDTAPAPAPVDNPEPAPADAPENTPPALNQTPQAKAAMGMYLANKMRNEYQQLDMYSHIFQAVSQMGAGVMRSIASSETASAGTSQAEATVYQALEHYLSTRQQISSGYANDMREALGKLLQMVRDVESARHQSASQIANI